MTLTQAPKRNGPIKNDWVTASFSEQLISPLLKVVAIHPSNPVVLKNLPSIASTTSCLQAIKRNLNAHIAANNAS